MLLQKRIGLVSRELTILQSLSIGSVDVCSFLFICLLLLSLSFSGSCGPRNIFPDLTNVLNFTSPGFPSQYPPNLECLWHIFAVDNKVNVLRIRSFDLERGFDELTIGDGNEAGKNEIARLTGQVKVRTVTSGSSTMWMMMSTDKTGQMSGFYLEIGQLQSGEVNSKCQKTMHALFSRQLLLLCSIVDHRMWDLLLCEHKNRNII